MPVQIFKQTTSKYDDTTIESNALLRSVQFAVSAPYSALFQVAKKGQSGEPSFDGNELIAQPGQGGFQQNIYGIRFKSFDPAHPTTILCKAFFQDDPIPSGDLASTSTFNTGGQVSPGGASVQVNKNGILVGTEPILDFIDSLGIAWNISDDLPNTKLKIGVAPLISAVPIPGFVIPNVTFTPYTWGAASIDTAGMVAAGSAATLKCVYPGIYLVIGQAFISAATPAGNKQSNTPCTGTGFHIGGLTINAPGDGNTGAGIGPCIGIFSMAANDTISFQTYQDSGGNITISSGSLIAIKIA